eukprot:3897369-Pyramimonas_sp.AAC.1
MCIRDSPGPGRPQDVRGGLHDLQYIADIHQSRTLLASSVAGETLRGKIAELKGLRGRIRHLRGGPPRVPRISQAGPRSPQDVRGGPQ